MTKQVLAAVDRKAPGKTQNEQRKSAMAKQASQYLGADRVRCRVLPHSNSRRVPRADRRHVSSARRMPLNCHRASLGKKLR